MRAAIIAFTVSLCCTAATFAQTGPALIAQPFADGKNLEAHADAAFFGNGHVKNTARDSFELNIYDADARWKITGEDQHNIRLGFALTYLDIDSSLVGTAQRLVDQSVALGATIGKWQDWTIDGAFGIGHAGDSPYRDAQAVYFMGDLVATKKLDESSSLQLFLNYDGNRTFMPDVPLPGIAYSHKVSDQFAYTLGVPFSTLTWKPMDRVRIDVNYSVPTTVNVVADYELCDALHAFGAFRNRLDAFALDGDVHDRRVFFEQRRVEGGLRWAACPNAEIEVAGGYAFSQRFTRGFDVRDTDTLFEVTDEPYIRVGATVTF